MIEKKIWVNSSGGTIAKESSEFGANDDDVNSDIVNHRKVQSFASNEIFQFA